MPNSSPNMNLPIPIVGQDSGLVWEQSVAAALTLLDAHNHSPGYGVPVPVAGLNIDANLDFQGHSGVGVNSLALFGSVIGTPDLLAIYSNGTDLFFKDANGNPIQLTRAGGPNAGTGNIQGLPSTPGGGAGVSWVNAASTFQFLLDSGSPGANIDVGSVLLRYIGSYPTPSGNAIILQAPAALASAFAITLMAALPGATALVQLDASGQLSASNTIANALTLSSTLAVVGNTTIGGTLTINSKKAVVGDETTSLKIIRGRFTLPGAVILSGSGFTVSRTAAGRYQISFTSSFGDAPSVNVSIQEAKGTLSNTLLMPVVDSPPPAAGVAHVGTVGSAGINEDPLSSIEMDFIACGSR